MCRYPNKDTEAALLGTRFLPLLLPGRAVKIENEVMATPQLDKTDRYAADNFVNGRLALPQ